MGFTLPDYSLDKMNGAETEISPDRLFHTAIELGKRDQFLQARAATGAIKDLNEGRKQLSVEQLNTATNEDGSKKYPNVDFTEGQSAEAAYFINDEAGKKQKMERILQQGNSNLFSGTIIPFLTRGVTTSIDPVNFAIGAGLAAMGGLVVKGAVSSGVTLGATSKFGIALSEAVAENAISEAVVMQAEHAQMMEYTKEQALTNILVGSFAMTGLIHGGSALFKKIGDVSSAQMYQHLSNHFDNNRVPDLDIPVSRVSRDLEIDPITDNIIRKNFGEDFLEEGDTLGTVFDRVKKNDDPKLVETFMKDLEDSGIEARRLNYTDKNSGIELTPDEIKNLKEISDMEESSVTFSRASKEAMDAAPDNVKETGHMETVAREYDEVIRKVENGDIPKERGTLLMDEIDKEVYEFSKADLLDAYVKCRLM